MTSGVLLIINGDSVPIQAPPNIAISPFDDEFGPRLIQHRRKRSFPGRRLQTAAGIQLQYPVEAAQMFVSVSLTLRQMQSRVCPRVGYAPVNDPGKLDAVHVGGHD